ncbi:MAG: hypothetical protein AB2565_08980 [Candidatus Thiodiazotropha endolucinida]|nr:hypothetical protein [Candidatus Thiodiazotropha endolucinida]
MKTLQEILHLPRIWRHDGTVLIHDCYGLTDYEIMRAVILEN